MIDELLRIFSYFLIIVLTEYIYRTYIYIIYLSGDVCLNILRVRAGRGGDDASWSSSLAQFAGQVSRSFACTARFSARSVCLSLSASVA